LREGKGISTREGIFAEGSLNGAGIKEAYRTYGIPDNYRCIDKKIGYFKNDMINYGYKQGEMGIPEFG